MFDAGWERDSGIREADVAVFLGRLIIDVRRLAKRNGKKNIDLEQELSR